MKKKAVLILLGLLLIQTNIMAKEKKDCSQIKKTSPKYLTCKIGNLVAKKDGVTLDTNNIKEKKYIIEWFKKKK